MIYIICIIHIHAPACHDLNTNTSGNQCFFVYTYNDYIDGVLTIQATATA